jgi:hypothetical protein
MSEKATKGLPVLTASQTAMDLRFIEISEIKRGGYMKENNHYPTMLNNEN